MASITSTYTDPSDTFVWWVEGDRIAIATSKGDADTTETGEGKLKPVQLGTTVSYQADDETPNLVNETFSAGDTTLTVDDGTNISVNDMLKIDDEILLVTAKSTNDLTVTRGYRDTTDAAHVNDSSISTVNVVSGGILISYKSEPDKVTAIQGTGSAIDLDNSLQPLLVDYIKGHALLDEAAKQTNPNMAQIKVGLAQAFLATFKEGLRRYAMKKNDKIGGTRAIVPPNLI